MELNESWTKNTSPEINRIYIEIIQYLKYYNEAMYSIQNMNLSNPFKWINWARKQWLQNNS